MSYDLTSNPVILWQITESLVKQDLYIILSGPDELIPSIKLANNQLLIEVYDQIKKAGIYDVKIKITFLVRLHLMIAEKNRT